MQPATNYAKSGDVNIAYQTVGQGPLDLVLVPGWVSNVDVAWEEPRHAYFLRRLGSFSRLILFDRRGTGLSDRGAAVPTLEERMDDVRAVMDAVGTQRAALFGYRGGGPMCLLFAATHPERTSALVLFGSYAKRTWAPDYPWGPRPEEHEEFMERIRRAWGTDLHAPLLAPSAAGDERFRQWWASYQRLSASPSAALSVARMNAEIDLRHVLPAIRVPALVLHRSGDREIDAGGSRYMAERIPGARYTELPGVDHLPWIGDADAVLDEVQEFLAGKRASVEADRVLLTILVADVVGACTDGVVPGDDRWRDRLATYRHAVRLAIERFRGVERSATRDGVLATFDGPGRAIDCARAIVEAARALGIAARAGLHTGECEAVGSELIGVAVEIAARVSARAGSGDVLVSSTVKDLVAGSGTEFEDVDVRLLTGPETAWKLYRVQGGPGGPGRAASTPFAEVAATEHGAKRLSRREREVAGLVARGRSNREIAEELSISVATAERHVANIFNKLGFGSRSQIAAWAVEHGLPPHRAG
jgi:pimeloyl-ACP methyl ester carboxylesterase/DNA-binding CsgD family transcriptional regulator